MVEEKKVPKLRFKGFVQEWEQRKLGDIYEKIRNAFVGTATPYYVENGHFYLESNNIKDGTINRNTEVYINDEFYKKQKDKWLKTGDLVMVQSGHVGHTAVIPKDLNNTAAHALIMFQIQKRKTNSYFLNYQLQTASSKQKIDIITTGNTIKHILASEMKNFEVFICSSNEENKIANFFETLDDTITLHQRKIEQLKLFKQAFLQKMLANQENVPEIRFADFDVYWEQHTLGETTDIRAGRDYKHLKSGNIPVYGTGGYMLSVDDALSFDKDAIGIGRKGTIDNPYILKAPFWTVDTLFYVIPRNGNEIDFFYSVFQKINWKSKDESTGVPSLSKSAINSILVYAPSKDEQKKIGAFFKYFDENILIHQHKVNLLKQLKKAFLQKMFI
ncbi:restriction endonuclease subunit S [Enterococcus casseliflavus]|uniref:Restriction endonuclease subunit S n=1 Tax=Enterococcus casseliflavus TaxID=37734 RepID=A0A415EPD0_ENTCA|nr:restriction endonuclease subunit S [Enterococcus casseliflavus]